MTRIEPLITKLAGYFITFTLLMAVAFSFYSVNFVYVKYIYLSLVERIFVITSYHVLFILMLWSQAMTVLARPISPPETFILQSRFPPTNEEEQQSLASEINDIVSIYNVVERGTDKKFRICIFCDNTLKPDRAHHCSTCNRCVLKMDHHCPWVSNCVGFHNYKTFILYLFYVLLFCALLALLTIYPLIRMTDSNIAFKDSIVTKIRVVGLISLVLSIGFAFGVASLLFFHMGLIKKNLTTLEQSREPTIADNSGQQNPYDLGSKKNFLQVFGNKWYLWLLPIRNSIGNGVTFETNLRHNSRPASPM